MARTCLMAVALLGALVLAAGQNTTTAPAKPAAVAPAKPAAAVTAPAKPAAVAPAKPAPAAPTCVFIDLTAKPYSERALCSSQVSKGTTITPKTIDSVMVISDLACTLLKFGSSDPAATVWGGAAGRCFNGDKYVTGETLVALKCCPTGATAGSALAKARDTNAESGVKVGKDLISLARSRDTAATMGTKPGSADLARARDEAAEMGTKPGSGDLAKQRDQAGEMGTKPGSADLARQRETAGDSGVQAGQQLARTRETASDGGETVGH